jgi:hypothetical protein
MMIDPPALQVEGGERVHRRDPERVVDQAVDPAELLERGLDQMLAGVLVGDVGRYDERPPAVPANHLGHLLQPPLGAGGQDQVGSHPGRLLAQGPAQAWSDAGEHDHLVLEQVHESILLATARWRAAIRAS